jgi:hypothetical protein
MNKTSMKTAFTFLLASVVLVGCRTAHDVAVTSFRVVDAPANYLRRHLDADDRERYTTTTVVETPSDVYTPGYPVTENEPPIQGQVAGPPPSTASSTRTSRRSSEPPVSSTPSVSTRRAPAPQQPPYAKPVPGKPGYVFSPYDPNGGYVDVTGYTPGSKVKDPYSGKVFLVP